LANGDLDTVWGLTLTDMVADVGKSVANAAEQLSKDQLKALESYPQELRDLGIPPVFYHMQQVDVELKVSMQMTSSTSDEKRGRIAAFFLGPKETQTDTVDTTSASTMRMRFAPGPVNDGQTGEVSDG
jgi:hypothetical protein